jgi:hypothetical protein
MAIQSIRCSVSATDITLVLDLENRVIRVICPEYEPDGSCRLMKNARSGGPLTQLLERATEHTLTTHETRCVMR